LDGADSFEEDGVLGLGVFLLSFTRGAGRSFLAGADSLLADGPFEGMTAAPLLPFFFKVSSAGADSFDEVGPFLLVVVSAAWTDAATANPHARAHSVFVKVMFIQFSPV
jgi:hypothetical protein